MVKGKSASQSSAAGKKTATGKSVAKETGKKAKKSLFVARKRNFSIGNDKLYRRDLKQAVKFPRYVNLQRKLKAVKKRLETPPQLQQFSNYCDAPTMQSKAPS